jgi:hypothetical protein
MRKNFKEVFPEPTIPLEQKKSDENLKLPEAEIRPTHPFASKVPRFQQDVIDSTGVYRRKKKTRALPIVVKKIFSAFGSSNERDLLVTKKPNLEVFPGVGVYNIDKPSKNFKLHSFGGDIKYKPAFEIVCMPINLDVKCDACEEIPKNVYWKCWRSHAIFCRSCYNQRVFDVKKKTRGIVEKFKSLQTIENDFERKRYCDFYHEHNKTTAAIRLLSPKEFRKRMNQENYLSTLFSY